MCYVMQLCRHTWERRGPTRLVVPYVVWDLLTSPLSSHELAYGLFKVKGWTVQGQRAFGQLHGYFDQETCLDTIP